MHSIANSCGVHLTVFGSHVSDPNAHTLHENPAGLEALSCTTKTVHQQGVAVMHLHTQALEFQELQKLIARCEQDVSIKHTWHEGGRDAGHTYPRESPALGLNIGGVAQLTTRPTANGNFVNSEPNVIQECLSECMHEVCIAL